MIKEDPTCGKLTDIPNKKYEQFFNLFKEVDTLDIPKWKPVHVIGFFCKKYKQHYNTDYKFKFNSTAPSKCFEVFQIKRLAMLLSSDPTILHDYIEWVFLNKVVKAKRRITSISFITTDGVVNEYKMNYLLSNNKETPINRSVNLPEKYKVVFNEAGVSLNTYGDLCFMSQMDPMPEQMVAAFDKIKLLGFDPDILKKIV